MKSKFQHRHYVAIAKVIADCAINEEAKHALISDMSEMFKHDNYGFSHDCFLMAATGLPMGRDK